MSVLRVAAEEAAIELPIPPYAIGLMALVFFALLLGVTWTFRNNAQKYVSPEGEHAHGGSQEGQSGRV
ncbi:MAG TPA: hypothetical protein VES95_01350 [Dermatophilaceae bacterium]|nr:hypothetical protein [Dermatophilaceae bacterium]